MCLQPSSPLAPSSKPNSVHTHLCANTHLVRKVVLIFKGLYFISIKRFHNILIWNASCSFGELIKNKKNNQDNVINVNCMSLLRCHKANTIACLSRLRISSGWESSLIELCVFSSTMLSSLLLHFPWSLAASSDLYFDTFPHSVSRLSPQILNIPPHSASCRYHEF